MLTQDELITASYFEKSLHWLAVYQKYMREWEEMSSEYYYKQAQMAIKLFGFCVYKAIERKEEFSFHEVVYVIQNN